MTYTFDDTVLDPDSHFKYYILGLFAADGTVGKNRSSYYIDLTLHQGDRVLLEDLRKFFHSTKPLSVSGNQLCFTLYSKKLYDLLVKFGITPRKSLNINIQEEIPSEFVSDFLRGVFDGDGCVTGRSASKADITLCQTASLSFSNQITQMYKDLGYNISTYESKSSSGNPLYLIKRGGVPGLIILSSLYRRGGFYLPRKYEKFLELSRPTLDEVMMETAFLFSQRSPCCRMKVGCVMTDENKNNVIAVGYNGGVSGLKNHCDSVFPGECGCIHAEVGALIKGKGPILYCTHMPCYQCAKLIANAGIQQVYYSETYRTSSATALFSAKNIRTKRIKRSKYLWKFERTNSEKVGDVKRTKIERSEAR
ncbi:MAG: hypothetical protein GF334_02980 [Candidatus Altiarchaeales archaeon]|nr:hypothetical protein [Candidatus Altiarchaeales archaeon]